MCKDTLWGNLRACPQFFYPVFLFLNYYNLERTHQGYCLKGRTPAQALRDALGIEELPPFIPDASEETTIPDAA